MTGLTSPRAVAAFCVGFAALLFFGVAAINVPHSASDAEMVEWWSKSSNLNAAIASMYLVAASALAFVPVAVHLRERLGRESPAAGRTVLAAGLLFAALLLASAATRGAIALGVQMNDEPLPGVDLLRYVPQLSYAFMNMALLTVGAAVLVIGGAAISSRGLARWFGWFSLVAGAGLVLLTPVIGPLTLPGLWVWAVTAGVAIWSPSREPVLRSASAFAP